MQISRHWRMNAQRYRLEGVRYQGGEVSLQSRPVTDDNPQEHKEMQVDARQSETVSAA